MTIQYIYLVVFFIIAYLIIADANIASACVYIFDIIKNKIKGKVWWMMNNPRNPVVKYMMWRRSMKLAKELMDEYENK